MVVDLDETLIHPILDGMARQDPRSDPPPDFVLKVDIEHHPVNFSVHKRHHVDYFLSIGIFTVLIQSICICLLMALVFILLCNYY